MELKTVFLACVRGEMEADGKVIVYYRLHTFDLSTNKYSALKIKPEEAEKCIASGVQIGDHISVKVGMVTKYNRETRKPDGEELAVISWD